MAKKTRKVLRQESQQRAYQQAVANVNAADVVVAPAPAVSAPTTAAGSSKFEAVGLQESAYVKSDVRRSLMLAGLFTAVMVLLSFIIR